MPVNKGRVRLLVAAPQSGLYEKGVGRLHKTAAPDQEEGWCCLGVASDVAAKFGLELDRKPAPYDCESFDGEASYLPRSVMEWYGFESNNPVLRTPDREISASTVNDTGYQVVGGHREASFKDIARFFKDTYLKNQK